MNVTFLLGNGFDINLGLKTKYGHFYDYYLNLPSTNENEGVTKLKKTINEDYKNWADFEEELGRNLDKFDEDEIFLLIEDVKKHLFDLVKKEENKFAYTKEFKEGLASDFRFPENYLTDKDRSEVMQFKNRWANSHLYLDIINFNYTTVLENLLDFKPNIELTRYGTSACILQDIIHVHGNELSNMVLGVNDASQVNNNAFNNNSDILDAIVKPNCNDSIGNLVDSKCMSILENSNLICMFGVSLGNTDKRWWNFIAERLKNDNCRLIYFSYEDGDIEHHYRRRAIQRKYKNKFLSHTDFDENNKNLISERIYVGHNPKIFKIEMKEKGISKIPKNTLIPHLDKEQLEELIDAAKEFV